MTLARRESHYIVLCTVRKTGALFSAVTCRSAAKPAIPSRLPLSTSTRVTPQIDQHDGNAVAILALPQVLIFVRERY